MPNLEFVEFANGLIGFTLTLMVLSYLIGDNPLFRFAVYLFVGVSAGYIAVVTWQQALMPKLFLPLIQAPWPGRALYLIPLFLFVLTLMKISPRLSWLGGPAMGYMAGVAAAAAVGGALFGTLLPQILAAAEPFDLGAADPLSSIFNGALLLLGTIATLAYFHFGARRASDGSARRNPLISLAAGIGQIFVALTFGVLFAGVYSAALTALIERIGALIGLFF